MVEKQKMVFFWIVVPYTRVLYDRLWDRESDGSSQRIGSLRSSYDRELVRSSEGYAEVLRGLGRFAPVTAANWSEVLRGMQKFLEDWVASLQLRPRICQLYVQTAEIAHNFMKPNPYRNDDTISQKYPISFWSKSHVPIPSTYK